MRRREEGTRTRVLPVNWAQGQPRGPGHRPEDNLRAALALHFAWYNLVRIHRSLRVTPAMAARVTDRVWGVEELLG